MKLYELTEKFQILDEYLNSDERPVSPEYLYEELNKIESDFKKKAENIVKFIVNDQSDMDQLHAEELRLQQKRKKIEQRSIWIQKYLMDNMQTMGLSSIKFDVLSVAIKQNPPSVSVVCQDAIPAEFIRIVPEQRVPDKIKILDTYKQNGEIVSGTEIVRTLKLTIR